MKQHYYLKGSVRGHCGHQHRTLSGLARCMRQDSNGCSRQGGYSDRRPVAVVDGEHIPLGALPEMDEYAQLLLEDH